MKHIKTLGLTLAIMAGAAGQALADEATFNSATVNDTIYTRMAAKIDAMNARLSAKVTAKIEALLKEGHAQRAQVPAQPYETVTAPVVEIEDTTYDLEKNRS